MNSSNLPASETTLRELMTRERWIEVSRILILGVISLLYWQGHIALPVLMVGVAFGLYPLVKTGLLDLVRERKIGTELFVTVATVVAQLGGEYVAGAVLLTIILIAEFIAELNTDRARASIKSLIGSVPRTALVRGTQGDQVVPIENIKVGDIVLVRGGEKIPVDGTVVGGQGAVNEAAISGESLPLDKSPSSLVLAGTVLESGALDIRTDKVGTDTLFARIIALVEEAEDQQAPVQKLADRVAGWLIPVVFVFLLGVYIVTRDVRLIVTLLIFTSPAELGLATPLVMIAAIARAARNGVLIKGGLHLEQLAKADVIVFDKTGTLTIGEPKVASIVVLDPSYTEDTVLTLAAAADRRSAHPLARAVVERASERQLKVPEPDNFEMVQGRGVKASVAGQMILLGNAALLKEHGVRSPEVEADAAGTTVMLAVDGRAIGMLVLADQIRPGATGVIKKLKAGGVKKIVILTGDNGRIAERVAKELGVDEFRADLLPADKVAAIETLRRAGNCVIMVGDGVNDAPALARADVGIAMGARGTQSAIEAADIALMTDDLSKIVFARALARRAYRTVQENIFVGVGVVHVMGITAALLGWIGPIEAAVLHLGPDVLVFLNSIKLLNCRIDTGSEGGVSTSRGESTPANS